MAYAAIPDSMAQLRTLASLFTAIGRGDLSSATSVAGTIIDAEQKAGHHQAARMLRGSLSHNGLEQTEFMAPASHAPTMLIREVEGPGLDRVELQPQTRSVVRELLAESRYASKLEAAGIPRRRSLLLSGPPGCGKTLTARSLGAELKLPVFTARLSAIIGSYLGQTGGNLRDLFAFAQRTRCVLLLDELDALGRTRGRSQDVGEIDRVIISLLQELDHSAPAGLIVGATNLPQNLDPALWRRFDVTLELPRPTPAQLRRFIQHRSREAGISAATVRRAITSKSPTYADVERVITDCRRRDFLRKAEADG